MAEVVKKAWEKPAVRSIAAGSAEGGGKPGNDGKSPTPNS